MNEVLFNKDFNSRKFKCTGEIHSYFKKNYIHSLDEEISDNIKKYVKNQLMMETLS